MKVNYQFNYGMTENQIPIKTDIALKNNHSIQISQSIIWELSASDFP